MTIFRFEPAKEVENLSKRMRKFMDEFPEGISFEVGGFNPKLDLAEDENNIIINVELPGILKENVKLSVQDNILTIKGEKKKNIEDEKVNYFRSERVFGAFSRSIELPVDVDVDNISAKFENGVLFILLAKTQKTTKEKTIEIK
jgi:HSP20 family protein